MTTATKDCRRCTLSKSVSDYTSNASNPDGLSNWCRDCTREAREARKAQAPKARKGKAQKPQAALMMRNGQRYIAPPGLLDLFAAIQSAAADGTPPEDVLFVGPSGSGKTEGARYLAEVAGLAFTKVDASAMTDPESWFGTREVVAEHGVSVTKYHPSSFVEAVQRRGLVLIDEANRIRPQDCNVLLPLMDGTRQVTNPLTGEVVQRHPECYIILSGNRGLQFVGTYSIEPALLTRVLTVPFGYLDAANETALTVERTGCSLNVAEVLVRFANEVRARAANDEDFSPVSTREVLRAARLIRHGASADTAVNATMIWQASDEGGSESSQTKLRQIWIGIRPLLEAAAPAPADEEDAYIYAGTTPANP